MEGAIRGWASEFFARRDLLFVLARREIKVKYKQSVMGFLWAVLMPAVIVGAGFMVRFAFAELSGAGLKREDLILVTVKAAPWAFFVSAVRFASSSLISNASLVTKIYMPREFFPIASVLAQLVDFAVASVVVSIVVALLGAQARTTLLWVPVLVLLLFLFTTALALVISAAGLFFRDVKYIVEVVLTFAIFFTPVFYEVSQFHRWSFALLLNPVAPVLEGIGAAVTGRPMPAAGWLAYTGVISVAGCIAAMGFFKKVEPYFAESI